MDKSRKSTGKVHKSVKSTLIGVLAGELVTIACLLIFSIIMATVNVPLSLTDTFVLISASVGGLVGGYCTGMMMKESGIMYGALCGGILVVILIIFNLISNGFASTALTFLKLVLVMAFSIVGCIVGVNKKSKRVKY